MVIKLINAAIVGYGRMGSGYGRDYNLLPKIWNPYSLREAINLSPGMKLRAVCDLNPDAMLDLPTDIERFTSYKLMIESLKPEFVAVTTRTQDRAEIAMLALENGTKMMHLEKPLCSSKIEIRNLKNLFSKHEAEFTYGTIRRYLAPYKFVKKLVKSGEFGNITKIVVNYGKEGLFWTHPHSIDLILYFVGEYKEMRIIEISGDRPEIEVVGEEITVITDPILNSAKIVFDELILAEITSEPTSTISIFCGKTEFHIVEDGRLVLQVEENGSEKIVWAEKDESAPAGYASVLGALSNLSPDSQDSHVKIAMEDAFKGQILLFDMCLKLAAHNLKGVELTEKVRFLGKAINGLFA